MSIVERAIGRLQQQNRSTGRPQETLRQSKAAMPAPEGLESTQPSEALKASQTTRHLQLGIGQLARAQLQLPPERARVVHDEVRRIKRKLLTSSSSDHQTSRELLVTSAVPEEGKSFLAYQLAESMAQEQDWSVLLVDGDLIRPRLSTALGVRESTGLSDLLADPSLPVTDSMFETDVPGLWFMPAGRPNPLGPELLAGSRMRELRERFLSMGPGWVIIYDSPPVLASNEAQALAQHVDRILMVVRAGSTSPQTLKEALTVVGEAKEISFVLNRVSDAPGSAYGGYYQSEPVGER